MFYSAGGGGLWDPGGGGGVRAGSRWGLVGLLVCLCRRTVTIRLCSTGGHHRKPYNYMLSHSSRRLWFDLIVTHLVPS